MDAFEVQNKLRTDPKSYIPKLEKMLKYFKGKVYKPPGESVGCTTNEGTSAV